jgi:uncharacterized NAD-dependent epimerase/dehydratase family protein|tara:strand:- start:7337 stop:8368 length:1032 start_codon:yes stop_codon:yes gene_type:complete
MSYYTILCPGAFDYISNKTGNMLIRYRPQEVCCVIDPDKSGQTAQDILGYGGKIPVVSNFYEAQDYSPNAMVIGSSSQGGRINEVYRKEIIAAIKYGCNIYNGMHQFLNNDPELATLAKKETVTINDIRCPPDPPHFPKGSWKKRKAKVMLIVGTDCNTGKMTTGWEITERLKKRGKNVQFVGTGQTGIMLAGNGVPVDAVVADFMAGEIEHAVDAVNDQADLIIVEGQGSLTNMYYAGVTLGLMHGAMPDYMIMTDEPGRAIDVSNNKMISIGDVMALHLLLMKYFKPSQFLGINLLTYKMNEELALKEIKKIGVKYQLPTTDLVRFGDSELIDHIEQELFW